MNSPQFLKRTVWIASLCLINAQLWAQVPTNQDCDGAIAVCQNIYFQANSFSGAGNYPNEINGFNSCLASGELNSVWYTFTVQQSGDLCFTIFPNNNLDDYDWAVYDLTNANCSDIFTDASLEVSCNYDPLGGLSAATGPNGSVGIGFEPCIPVLAGETYMVNISNFSSSQFGYTLDFGASTAVIFDNVSPEIDSVVTPVFCGTTSLTFRFTENVLCNTVEDADFLLTGPGGPYVLSGVNGAVCNSGGDQENTYTINVSPPITTPGVYDLELTALSGSVTDLCGNAASPATRTFSLDFVPIDAGLDNSVIVCQTEGPVNLFGEISGTPDAGGIWLGPGGGIFGGVFTPGTDGDGTYVYVVGSPPCPTDTSLLSVSTQPPPNAGSDTSLTICDSSIIDLFALLAGGPDAGGTWTGPGGIASGGTFTLGTDPAGIYTYSVAAVGGCPAVSSQVTVSINPIINAGTSVSLSVCEDGAPFDLFAQLGGNPDVGGSWTDPLGNPIGNVFTPGTSLPGGYTYTVLGTAPCPDQSAVVTISEVALPDPGISSTLLICEGGPSINLISALGGSPDAGGSWTDGLGNPFGGTFDPAIHFPGTYTYTVPGTAPCGPQAANLVITVAPSPDLSLLSFVDVACFGDNSGSITVNGSGGTAPLQFEINNGPLQASPNFTGLPAATYQVAVEDVNGCRDSLSQTISEPDLLVVQIDSVLPVDCQGNATGLIIGTAQGGVAPYEYSLDGVNYVSSGTFINLGASTYSFFVRDANACVSSVNVLVTQPELLTANIGSQTNVDCFGNATGSVSLNVGGGIGPYLFSIDGLNFLPQTTFSGLSAGNYTITIQDSNLCVTTVPVTITEPPLLVASIPVLTGVDCFGNSSGSLTGGAAGGTAPYEYSLDGVNFAPANTFTGLGAGFYTLYVQDVNGCLASIDTTMTSPTGLLSGVDSVEMVLCNGGNNGLIALISQGGVAPYSYSLDGITYGPNAFFPGLTAGVYTIFTQDANGCIVASNQTITEPSALILNMDNQINVLCNGDSTASIALSASGGVGGYEFTLDGTNYQASGNFSQLPAGNYFFSVQDSNLCQTTLPITITEPSPVQILLAQQRNVDCFGNLTGEIEVEGGGGTPVYSFSMDGGPFGPGQVFSGLGQGTYTFYVQDGNGCLDSLSTTIQEPDSLVASIGQVGMVDCYDNATGSLEVLVSGGSPIYEYVLNGGPSQSGNLFTDLTAGLYQITVTDDSSCVDTTSVLITQPDSLDLSVAFVKGVDCFGNATAAIHLLTEGGSPEYQYSIDGSPFQSDSFFVGLVAGSYQIEVLDDQGCRDTLLVPISEPPLLTASADSILDVACFGDSTGWVSVLAAGGSPQYEYQLNAGPFQSDSFFTQLPMGPYTIVVRDDSLCEVQFDVNITEPPLLQAVVNQQKNSSCYGDSSGWVEILANGGTQPYEYSLDGINYQDSLRFENLIAGTYQITVRDSQLCTTTVSFEITQPDSIQLSFPQLTPADCYANATGGVEISANGGTAPFQFSLDSVLFQPNGNFSGLLAGLYAVVVLDDSGCVQVDTFRITQPDSLELFVEGIVPVACFGESSGEIRLSGTGGVRPYQYALDGGGLQANSNFGNLLMGYYSVELIDANGCDANLDSLFVFEPDTLIATTIADSVLCFGEATGSASVEIQGGTRPYAIQWDDGNSQTGLQAVNLQAGVYTVTVRDSNDCVAAAMEEVGEPELLEISLVEVGDAFCNWANGSAEVSATGGVGGYQFAWNTSPPGQGIRQDDLVEGRYVVRLSDRNDCQDTLSFRIGNTPPATASFTGTPNPSDTLLLSQASIQFQNTSKGAVAYEWDFGTLGALSDEENPSFTYEETGEYVIRLRAFNEFFVCPSDTSIRLVVIPDGVIYFPNAFSPNGDGSNDEFYLGWEGVVTFEMIIFDRWGREILRTNQPDFRWDGYKPGEGPVPEGVYVFVVKASLNNGTRQERSGSITLIR